MCNGDIERRYCLIIARMRPNINLTGLLLLVAASCLFLSACPSGDDGANVSKADTTGADPAVSASNQSLPPADSAAGSEAAANPCGTEAPAAVADASDVFKTANCTMCHGQNMEGGQLAPALKNIAGEWNKAELTSYVRDASKYEDKGNRLSHDPKYVIEMPPFPMGEDDLNKLVDWLLTK